MEIDYPSKPFVGVHFVLLGFDPIDEQEVRAKLIDGGGVDVGLYSQSCTHVIVDQIIYDDPVCVAARTDGKTLVTSLWVGHSFDSGMPADAALIMYRPVKDLSGIPGAKNLVMCLTGYQRQDREDIMILAGLMGAQFSKPLTANKVTHLICYKFEGEKYELAKKMKTIKLVNHRWLEDCLKDWKLLPEANYDKSGYELETMEAEAEAKDSEEEAEDFTLKQFGVRNAGRSPQNLRFGIINACESPKSSVERQKLLVGSTVPEAPLGIDNVGGMLSTPGSASRSHQTTNSDNVNVSEVNGWLYTGASRVDCHERSPNSLKVACYLASTSKNADCSSYSGSKISSMSYSRKNPRKSTLTLSSEKVDNGASDIMSSKVENTDAGTATNCGGTSKREGESCHDKLLNDVLPQKRMSSSPDASSKSQKNRHNARACNPDSPVKNNTRGLEAKSSVCHSDEFGNGFSSGCKGHYTDEAANLRAALNKRPFTPDLPSSKTVTSEALHSESAASYPLKTSRGPKDPPVAGNFDHGDCGIRSAHVVAEAELPHQHHDFEDSSAKNRVFSMEQSPSLLNVDSPKGGSDKLIAKNNRKKMVAKKTLGSGHSANRKGSIYPNRTTSLGNPVVCLSREEKRSNQEKCGDYSVTTMDDETEAPDGKDESEFEKTLKDKNSEEALFFHEEDTMMKRIAGGGQNASDTKACPLGEIGGKDGMNTEAGMIVSDKTFSLGESISKSNVMKQEIGKIKKWSSRKANAKTVSADKSTVECREGESEAPKEEDEDEFEKAINDEKSEGVKVTCEEDTAVKVNESIFCIRGEKMGKDGMHNEIGMSVSGEKYDMDESTSKRGSMKLKINKGKKRTLGKAKSKNVSAVKNRAEFKKDVAGEILNAEKSKEDCKKEEKVLLPRSETCVSPASARKLGSSTEMEKENRPVAEKGQSPSPSIGKSILKSMKVPLTDKSISAAASKSVCKPKDGPVWFILSGHRLQRKEFQQVIRRLKGRFCRDSHQWSYQATHFIAPDPIRRTEKFFAAAASGRWILKTDYLSACSQAGKFLPEEPYEWHKNGLSEDGAINLEAPRKWRLLRERTGHGTFHGMRIIVYGDCIAPPLDTLKRVVKAGDGNILATSPPYTRFLSSGVNFAVVSPGMPRVDMWVQEFLKHEIPCVLADYLVEFVCKPGCSLERHVLYNTHAWAETSLANMLSKRNEIVMDSSPPNDYVTDDITCGVCGCSDRGDVMLICGDESGSVGCGVGTHIDCCDPPLESVPEEDWFCRKCSRSSTKLSKKVKKG